MSGIQQNLWNSVQLVLTYTFSVSVAPPYGQGSKCLLWKPIPNLFWWLDQCLQSYGQVIVSLTLNEEISIDSSLLTDPAHLYKLPWDFIPNVVLIESNLSQVGVVLIGALLIMSYPCALFFDNIPNIKHINRNENKHQLALLFADFFLRFR